MRGTVDVVVRPADVGRRIAWAAVEVASEAEDWRAISTLTERNFDVFVAGAGGLRSHVAVTRNARVAELIAEALREEDTSADVDVVESRTRAWRTGSSLTAAWDTSRVEDGAYRLRVTTGDTRGQVVHSPEVAVTVANALLVTAEPPELPRFAGGVVSVEPRMSEPERVRGVVLYAAQAGGDAKEIARSDGAQPLALDTTQLPDGLHDFHVLATYDDESVAFSAPRGGVLVDNTPPSVELAGVEERSTVSGVVAIRARGRDYGSGIDSVRISVSRRGTEWNTVAVGSDRAEAQWDTTECEDGAWLVRGEALDAAGNTATATTEVVLENAPPEAELVRPDVGAVVSAEVAVVARGGHDALVSVDASRDDQEWTPLGEGPELVEVAWDTSALVEGPWRLRVTAERRGQVTTTEVPVVVDNNAPSVRLVAPSPGMIVAGRVRVGAEVADEASGIAGVRFVVAGRDGIWSDLDEELAEPPYAADWDTEGLTPGDYWLCATAADRAANGAASPLVHVRVAGRAPGLGSVGARRLPTLAELERLLDEADDEPVRRAEREAVIQSLAEHIEPDERIPRQFATIVDEEFGDLLGWR